MLRRGCRNLIRQAGYGAAMFGVTAVLLFAPRPALSAEGVVLGYEGYLGGLHMLTAEVELARNAERYRMETTANGRGLFGWLVNWQSKAVTEGAIAADGRLRPEWHQRDIAQRGRNPKIIQIEYRDDGVPLVARMRAGAEANFTERAERRGTMDPMSAVAAIIDQMAAGAACKGTFEVFDGKLRYDVKARPQKPSVLNGNKYMMYRGDATRCNLLLKEIGGKKKYPDSPRDRKPADDSLELSMWFASPGKGMPAVPVMASARTDYGGLRIYLARAESVTVSKPMRRADAR